MNVLVGVALLLGHNFFGSSNLRHRVSRGIFFVFLMEEVIEMMNSWDDIEVMFFRRIGRHPLEAAGIPWVKWRLLRISSRDHNIDQEQQNANRKNERAD